LARKAKTQGPLIGGLAIPAASSAREGEMAMPLPLKDCYERRVRYFADQFALTSESLPSEAIHEMRVGLKRLRSFFNLVGSITPAFGAEEAFAPARKLFRAAGELRNLHVIEAKVREASRTASLELSEYYNWLKEGERREAKKFCRACRRFGRGFFSSAWTMMVSYLEGPAAPRVRKRTEDRLLALIKEIKQERSMRHDVRRLHFLRTRTKEARYTLEILQECGLTGDDGARLNERLRDVHQSLGRWHDEEVVLESLREFRKNRMAGPLVSFKSYLAFSRLTKANKAQSLADFEAARAALLAFLGRGYGRRVLRPLSARLGPGDAAAPVEKPEGPE
jgi:CHAD domain-containing protein